LKEVLSSFSNRENFNSTYIKNSSDVVYGAICTDCPKDRNRPHYIGETSQLLGKRFEGHFYDRKNHTAIYDHIKDTGHKRPVVFILHRESDANRRKIMEGYYIRTLCPPWNRDSGIGLYLGSEFQKLVTFNYDKAMSSGWQP